MKGKKYKRSETFIKKIYEKAFGLRQPYQVVVDAEFCRELLRCKVIAKEILPVVLGGAVKIMASACVLDELRRMDEAAVDGVTGSAFVAKRFELRNCRHPTFGSCSTNCLEDLIGKDNLHHYVAAVQNYDLRKKLRDIPGVPLVFVNRGIVLMEDPTKATISLAHDQELNKLRPKEYELKALSRAKELKSASELEEEKTKKKRKGKKQPNPLAVKKPKAKTAVAVVLPEVQKPKRKRRSKKKSSANEPAPSRT